MIAFSPESHTTWLSPYSHSYTTASLFVILMLRFPCVSRIPHTCATRLYHRSDISRQGCPQGAFSLCIVYAPLKASHALTFNCQGNPVLLQDTVCPQGGFSLLVTSTSDMTLTFYPLYRVRFMEPPKSTKTADVLPSWTRFTVCLMSLRLSTMQLYHDQKINANCSFLAFLAVSGGMVITFFGLFKPFLG